MTATEELRRLLDERGVEYTANERDTQWWPKDNPAGVLAENSRYPRDTLDVYGLTPAQAVAATLGSGMLTADDVRDLVERHSDASGGNGRDFHNGAYAAIADELNATLGSCNCSDNCTNSERTRTCRNIAPSYLDFLCSECGFVHYHSDTNDTGDDNDWSFCPNCGRKVVDA